jgi:hypothetical protein
MFHAFPIRAAKLALLAAVAAFPFAAEAQAQELSLRLGKGGKHGGIEIRLGDHGGHVRYEPRERACEPARVWVPGRYEIRRERVWVPGCERKEWVPPRHEWRIDKCGSRYRVLVRDGYWRVVQDPGRYETRDVRVWVPGHWQISGGRY